MCFPATASFTAATVLLPAGVVSVTQDGKPLASINLIRDLLTRLAFKGNNRDADLPDPEVVFSFHEDALSNGSLAK